MATSATGVITPDIGTAYNPPVDLAVMADSIDTIVLGLEDVNTERSNYGVGTTSERTAALASFPNGAKWYDTTLSAEYRRVAGAWVLVPAPVSDAYNYRWADAAARAAQTGMVAGDVGYQTDTGIEYLRTASAWVANPTVCALRKSTTQNLTTSATALSWDVEISDNSGMHDNVTNNTRITATRAGLYEFLVSLYNSNTSGMGTVYGRLNGTTDIPGSLDRDTADATAALPLRTTFPIALVAGDYVEIMVLHATASGTIAGGTSQGAAVVTAKWIGPA